MVKPYQGPALTAQHEIILGWLSSCASLHLCEHCVAERRCFRFWDVVAAKTPGQIDKDYGHYEQDWHGIQESIEPHHAPALSFPLPTIIREES